MKLNSGKFFAKLFFKKAAFFSKKVGYSPRVLYESSDEDYQDEEGENKLQVGL